MRNSEKPWPDHEPLTEIRGKLRTKARRIGRRLEEAYGLPRKKSRQDPLDVLIRTILSQNTNDRNSERAFRRLRARFLTWEDVLVRDLDEVIEALRPGGLAAQKAVRIRELLKWVQRQYGRMSLASLKEMGSLEVARALRSLQGIGPKTVHCLLLFGLGREAFPVDTHILRVTKRLGLMPKNFDGEKAHDWMKGLVPEGRSLSLHLNLIRFGRLICRARTPRCGACFLRGECLSVMAPVEGEGRLHDAPRSKSDQSTPSYR